MEKNKLVLKLSLSILLLELLSIFFLSTREIWAETAEPVFGITLVLFAVWAGGTLHIYVGKASSRKAASRVLTVSNIVSSAVVLVLYGGLLLLRFYPYSGGFSITTPLFEQKKVMIVVPHQDDDINLMGGLIEQYTDAGSDVSVVFSTNGDRFADPGIRADEAVAVLTSLGVKKENIYYLGFGDQWISQNCDGTEISHIYHSSDPDLLWTSCYGATATYGTKSIPCYLELPYTRNHYVYSFQQILQEIMPDTIFAVDFDPHIDHEATGLLFEEALCNVLTVNPAYHPEVYKGFCYSTAWEAAGDYFGSMNLLSTRQPEDAVWSETAFGYTWENRVRFPMNEANLNRVLFCNSVYESLKQYRSQGACLRSKRILNGDKVFWERRTDSLLYDAQILVDGESAPLLNDFKLKDFCIAADGATVMNGFVPMQGRKVSIKTAGAITLNSVYLYDNPDLSQNILEGHLTFSDGSRLEFGALNKDGSATKLTFTEKQISWMEITVTGQEGEQAGFSEIEAFYDAPVLQEEVYLMAVDEEDNFVYDYLIHGSSNAAFRVCSFPSKNVLNQENVTATLVSDTNEAACYWEQDQLIVNCPAGSVCTVTLSDGNQSTTFTVSNPAESEYAFLRAVRFMDRTSFNIRVLLNTAKEQLSYMVHKYILRT